jgi:hypothetical protein
VLSLHSPDLSHEHWRQELEASPGLSVAQGRATTGVIGEHLDVIEIGSGEVVDRIPCHGEVGIVASGLTDHHAPGGDLGSHQPIRPAPLDAREGQRPIQAGREHGGSARDVAELLLPTVVRDAATGGPLWEFQPEPEGGGGLRDRSAQMVDVAIVEDGSWPSLATDACLRFRWRAARS